MLISYWPMTVYLFLQPTPSRCYGYKLTELNGDSLFAKKNDSAMCKARHLGSQGDRTDVLYCILSRVLGFLEGRPLLCISAGELPRPRFS